MELNRRISPRDVMLLPGGEAHYFSVGESAIHEIGIALQMAGNRAPARALDLPCGYGRVLRRLRTEYPDAQITACDIDLDALQFCGEEFDAIPVQSSEDCSIVGAVLSLRI